MILGRSMAHCTTFVAIVQTLSPHGLVIQLQFKQKLYFEPGKTLTWFSLCFWSTFCSETTLKWAAMAGISQSNTSVQQIREGIMAPEKSTKRNSIITKADIIQQCPTPKWMLTSEVRLKCYLLEWS